MKRPLLALAAYAVLVTLTLFGAAYAAQEMDNNA